MRKYSLVLTENSIEFTENEIYEYKVSEVDEIKRERTIGSIRIELVSDMIPSKAKERMFNFCKCILSNELVDHTRQIYKMLEVLSGESVV